MAKRPWKSKDYFVSPWDYAEEVTKGFDLPSKVQFHDITLRDGEQQSGLVFRKSDKVRIAEALRRVCRSSRSRMPRRFGPS